MMKKTIYLSLLLLCAACAPTQQGPPDINAAKRHSGLVYQVASSALASLPRATAPMVAAQVEDCLAAGRFQGSETSFGDYSFPAAPFGVKECTVKARGNTDFTVTVTMTNGMIFINGR
jgi:hypothetical protein